MCRPSCCNTSGSPGAGIAAVAVIIVGALIAAKLGPVVTHIVHTVEEVIRLIALALGMVVVLAAITWAAIAIGRWQLRRKTLTAAPTQMVTTYTTRIQPHQVGQPECLACGGTGTVLRAIGTGRYQPATCPVCEPIQRAG